jgi:predicted RNase H-like nuclease (RuvC/YqgF family)
LEDRIIQDRENLNKASEDIVILQNKINQKDIVIEHLKKELEKFFNNNESSIKKEILITEPNKVNIDLNNELNYTRDVLTKISKMLQSEKGKNDQIESKVIVI